MVYIVTESALIDDILGPHQKGLGTGYLGYRNHCFRMLNIGRYLVPDEPHRDDRFAIMAAFHDLPFFLDGNLDYLGRASDWARDYLEAMGDVAKECYRVLKKDKCCAILIGDTRKHRHFVPISYAVLREFIDAGFVLLEDIIKVQHKTASDRGRWRGTRQNFYKIAHEHLFVFRKPENGSELKKLRLSRPTAGVSDGSQGRPAE